LTEPLLVLKKLAVLREHVARVRRRRPETVEAFVSDVDIQDAAALSFVVSVQEASDIALHIAADEGWGLPGSYKDAFEILAQHGVITVPHGKQLADCARVRNRIVHGYTSVDAERLWTEFPIGLDALDRFVEAIAKLVGDAES
jgi:uncharacterized protein YutE (UPF0331/DUF86 family)